MPNLIFWHYKMPVSNPLELQREISVVVLGPMCDCDVQLHVGYVFRERELMNSCSRSLYVVVRPSVCRL